MPVLFLFFVACFFMVVAFFLAEFFSGGFFGAGYREEAAMVRKKPCHMSHATCHAPQATCDGYYLQAATAHTFLAAAFLGTVCTFNTV